MDEVILPQWAKRIPQHEIKRLYESDAQGLLDDDLLDKVGWALRARCESFINAVEAVKGHIYCPRCGQEIWHKAIKDEILLCANCGWESTWQTYFQTIQHKQLSGAVEVIELFENYINEFPEAKTSQEKMLLIDRLIHGFHWNLVTGPSRAVAVNLIEGRYHEVVAFLNQLSYGDGSTPGTAASYHEWQKSVTFTAKNWDDERLNLLAPDQLTDQTSNNHNN